jgi:hypothetical protein
MGKDTVAHQPGNAAQKDSRRHQESMSSHPSVG